MANSAKWFPNVDGTTKAWTNLNGTETIAAADDFNVMSYNDKGTGNYDCNFSSNMGNANYSYSGNSDNAITGGVGGILACPDGGTYTVSTAEIFTRNSSDTARDCARVTLKIHGDLA